MGAQCGRTRFFLFLLLSAIGCSPSQTQKDGGFVPVANGFGFGQHSKETYPGHRAIWADFEYRDTNGVKTVVWPYLNSVDYLHITNHLAVFLGDKLWHYRNGREGLV